VRAPGLPDGLVSNQKSQFGYILEGLAMDDTGIFYSNSVYFMALWYILWTLVYFVVILCTNIPRFGILCREKSGKPGANY
jgi:hypothetical protein